jgi:membrane protein DedA with SNARE-associated domain
MNALPKEITRRDLESKFRELQGEVESVGESAKSYAVIVGAVAAVAVVGVAYFLGRRRGRKRTTVVEVRRL